jgi:hypothetical protein
MVTCPTPAPVRIFASSIEPRQYREAAKLAYPTYKEDRRIREVMEQHIVNAMTNIGSEANWQMKGLVARMQLALVLAGYPMVDEQTITYGITPDNNLENKLNPKGVLAFLDTLRVYGNPAGTLPVYLDDLYEEYKYLIDHPFVLIPTDQPE